MNASVKSVVLAVALAMPTGLRAQLGIVGGPSRLGNPNLTSTCSTAGNYDEGETNAAASEHASDAGASGNDGRAGDSQFRAFLHRLQVHGTLSQGFIYGSGNNYLTMNTNDGSARWSEGALNVSSAITENFHAGVQIHSYIMGQIGRGNLQVDWAVGDYRVKEWLGFRGGKFKAPMGLFNEIQDTDTLYNWALLPQSMYEAEYRSYNIPVVGGEIYGTFRPRKGGRVEVQLFGGRRSVANNDGSDLLAYQLYGIEIRNVSGYTWGGDLKWMTPIRGLTGAASLDRTREFIPDAPWPINPFGVPLVLKIDSVFSREIFSVEYRRGKIDLIAEGKYEPHWVANNNVSDGYSPRNAWYVMGSYRPRAKVALGSYFSRVWGTGFIATFSWPFYNPINPAFYSNDTVVNARYDLNHYFYVKLEGHYIDGDLAAFFPETNPDGLQKVTRLAIARVGFTF